MTDQQLMIVMAAAQNVVPEARSRFLLPLSSRLVVNQRAGRDVDHINKDLHRKVATTMRALDEAAA